MQRFLVFSSVILMAVAARARDVSSDPVHPLIGYGYFAVGGCNHGYTHVGGGGGAEVFLWRGLTLGADGSYHQFIDDVSFGVALVNVNYHYGRTGKVDPFLSFSPAGIYQSGGAGYAISLGGGIDFWFRDRMGLRGEALLQLLGTEEGLGTLLVGVTFR